MCLDFLNLLDSEEKEEKQNARDLFDSFIIYAYYKYDCSIDSVLFAVKGYTTNMDESYITRDNDFRIKFVQNMTPRTIIDITSGNIVDYVKNRVREEEVYVRKHFIAACLLTLSKYSIRQLSDTIENGLRGNYDYFTNDNNAREMLYQSVPTDLFKKYVFDLASNYDYTNQNIGEIVANAIMEIQIQKDDLKNNRIIK